ncbi:hypothetical protein GCM10009839_92260 [Catenulispora yoronensis]|uniref:Secreted protein n=1 Tax=Catenulispora yoronensis TaxID=450799 RepID=A0ABP5H8S2_9ACTN
MKRLKAYAVAAALASVVVAGGSSASAAVARPAAARSSGGWIGQCYPWHDKNTFGGWCDGNGPYSYQAMAECADWTWSAGVVVWAGNRNGSYAYCAGHGGLASGTSWYWNYLPYG